MRIRFKEGNTLRYRQDFANRIGVPVGIWFECEIRPSHYILRAPGYGGRPYGNGCLYLFSHQQFFAKGALR